ncbi:acetyltransferase [Aaosphaeria arxii CBS 175.79]|uniref:Acetyltransferase n=1 Tax=Aaosphaeria arxii CBS 175.79 TaxID=1450172 RepID=A0A6A5XL64_9PLEO|nr:acetyltransferase [Aaosphaeria arxii CBS 175.79]KAF2013882.1 acetyltransferase [Aaosphaeria arxii CBS 175.79]
MEPADFALGLDVLGEQPMLLKLYTQISNIYQLPDDISHDVIVKTLKDGLHRLSASFPWIAGQVVNQTPESTTPTYRIVPLEPAPRLVVRDLSSKLSFEEMERANFPFSMLDEDDIAPCRTFAGFPSSTTDASADGNEAPVFLVQINFISGGLFLTFNAQHNVMDMTGQGQMIELLDKACRGEEFTEEELRIGNMARENVVELLGEDYVPGDELKYQLSPPPDSTSSNSDPPPPQEPPSCKWTYFNVPPASLKTIKDLATSTLPPTSTSTSNPQFISTDDALTSHVYLSILRARLPRLPNNTSKTTTTLARAVDARPFLSLPSTYPGLLQNMTYHTNPLSSLPSLPLGHLASSLRTAIHPSTTDIPHRSRALATYLRRPPPDARPANFTATLDPAGPDFMISSWCKIPLYALDFGLGVGVPRAVRRPRFEPAVEGLCYLMPKGADGGVVVGVGIREDDLKVLRELEGWKDVVVELG